MTWKSLSESNNYGFEIQRRSSTGSYKKIGFVQGRGSAGIAHEYRYVDYTTTADSTLFYRLRQIDLDGASVFAGTVRVSAAVPSRFVLFPNYPNPFNARTRICYTLPDDTPVLIRLYDVRGERVATLIDSFQSAGEHSVFWQADSTPAGIYFLRIDAGPYSAVNKCLLIN